MADTPKRTGKAAKIDYAALERDLREAAEAARKVKSIKGDGGPATIYIVTVRLPRALVAKVSAAARAAGLPEPYRHYSGSFGFYPPRIDYAQGYLQKARVDAMAELLKRRGWQVDIMLWEN